MHFFHSDVCQGVYLIYQQKEQLVDIITFSMYKLGGMPLGIVLSKTELSDNYWGTPDTAVIENAGFVIQEYIKTYHSEAIESIKHSIIEHINNIKEKLGIDITNISGPKSIPNIVTFILPPGYESVTIQKMLSEKGFYIGTGSACSSLNKKGSHVLSAMGYSGRALIRFSFDETNIQINSMMLELFEILKNLKVLMTNSISGKKSNSNWNNKIDSNHAKPTIIEGKIRTKEYRSLNLPNDLPLFIPKTLIRLSVAELYLKGSNKYKYLTKLKNNIIDNLGIAKENVKPIGNTIHVMNHNDPQIFKNIAGLAKNSQCYHIQKYEKQNTEAMCDLKQLVGCVVGILNGKNKFRLTIKYSGIKTFYNMTTNIFTVQLGQYLIDRCGLAVDLTNYDIDVKIIVSRNEIIIPIQEIKGIGGLPVGTSGRAVLLVCSDQLTKREEKSLHMATTRGSKVSIKNTRELNKNDISNFDYILCEPSNYLFRVMVNGKRSWFTHN